MRECEQMERGSHHKAQILMRSANSLLFFTLLIFLIECVVSFLLLVLRSSYYSLIMPTVYDSRNQPSAYGLVSLVLLFRISYFCWSFLLDFEVELSRSSSFCLFGESSGLLEMVESVSLMFDDVLPTSFLPVLDPLRSFSVDLPPGLFPTGSFLVVFCVARAGTTVLPIGSGDEAATLGCLEGSIEEVRAPCCNSLEGRALRCCDQAADAPQPISVLINLF